MWHLMGLTLSFVCCLSAINYVVAAPIDSDEEAVRYLGRFGYLEREPHDSSYPESVSAESFRSAIKDFQSFAGLNKTGDLDKETLEVMNKPRCGVPDRIRPGSSSTRRKRFALEGSHWPKKKLTYKIKKYTTDMSPANVDGEIARAFQMWANVTDLTFVHVNNQSADVDIDILFASGEHGSCKSFNDGPGGVQAHAAHPINGGDAHFDEGETWTLDSDKGTNLLQVATHEFGHSLGLEHTHVKTAVMFPTYDYHSDLKLDKDDIEGIQELYGEKQFSRKLALELKATLDLLKTTVNNLEKKNIELRNDLIDTRTNLNKKLEATTELLTTTVAKTNIELRNAKSDFNKRLKECTSSKHELEKTRADFTITVDDLSAKLNATEKELGKTKITTGNLSAELKTNSDRISQELKVTAENFKKDLRATSNDLKTTKTNLASTRTELNRTKSAVADLATEFKARTSEKVDTRTTEIVDIGKMPSSCADLQRMGQKVNGFFLVKGSKKMEMIYCNFLANQNDKQKWIGYADVKSAPVHFYVQRNSPFGTRDTPVPFELVRVNEGDAMNLTSGKFTAPRPGNYFFSFTGTARLYSSSSFVYFFSSLFLNGKIIGSSFIEEHNVPVFRYSPFTLQSTLNLKTGDRVWVQIANSGDSYLSDSPDQHFTHFTGFMLEEEIAASL